MSDYVRSKFTLEGSHGAQVASQFGRIKIKGDRTHRSWSDCEEANLLLSLRELVAHGWKSDNGFRAGYLTKLDEALKREFPSSDLKGTPHITSKITAWKKCYYSLCAILERSGVGFGPDNKIDCDDAQWEQVVKLDPNARGMRNKTWPYWEQWNEIFGKDRANGAGAEDIMDAVNELYSQQRPYSTEQGQNYNPGLEGLSATVPLPKQSTPEGAEESTCQSAKVAEFAKGLTMKRKRGEALENLVNLLGKMHDDTNARLECLSMRIGYEFDLSKARKEVYDLLGTIPGLTMMQKFDAGEIILEKVERFDFFMGLPECARLPYVMRALDKHGAM
ncbi:hypothetical protein AAHA92_16006 [Salvia divinorum]|uniref:Myb/SANT-like domain-containing protein n=1 Tax=Salvia divinorum TaxID=28513 RepID=A0ABD1GU61_SALDI